MFVADMVNRGLSSLPVVGPLYTKTVATASSQVHNVQSAIVSTAWFGRVDAILSHVHQSVQQQRSKFALTDSSEHEAEGGAPLEHQHGGSTAPSTASSGNRATAFVTSNAQALYSATLQYYLWLAERTRERQVSLSVFLDGMRQRLGHVWNDRLATQLKELYARAQTLSVEELRVRVQALRQDAPSSTALWHRVTGLTGSLTTNLRVAVNDRWNSALCGAEAAIDYVLPEQQQQKPQQQQQNQLQQEHHDEGRSLGRLRTRLSKRLRSKAAKQWGTVRELSATRVKSMIHIDLIAYAEQVIDVAESQVKKTTRAPLPYVQAAYEASLERTKLALEAVKQVAVLAKESAESNPRLAALRTRLQDAKERARTNARTVGSRVSDVAHFAYSAIGGRPIKQLPHDAYVLAAMTVGIQPHDPNFDLFVAKLQDLGVAVRSLVFFTDHSNRMDETLNTETTTTDTATTETTTTPNDANNTSSLDDSGSDMDVEIDTAIEEVSVSAAAQERAAMDEVQSELHDDEINH